MSHRQSRTARLAADALEARAVPAVTVVESFRPFIFTMQGTISTEETTAPPSDETGGAGEPITEPTTDVYDGTFTARGSIDYTGATEGTSGLVNVTGSGRGVTNLGSYTNTFTGTFTLADDNGAWTTVEPYTGTETWTSGRGSTTEPTGPVEGAGTFDVSKYTFTSTWDSNEDGTTSRGEVRATVSQTGLPPTDLAITGATATAGETGIDVSLTAEVTGQLMKATGETAAATHLVATWEGADGETLDADIRVPISWNAGTLTADITALEAPSWATKLVLRIDGTNEVPEANELNNSWELDVEELVVGEQPPPPPLLPQPLASQFQIAQDGTNHILWLTESGHLLFRVPSFGSDFTGPVNLAVGDVTGDGDVDVVVAAGTGGGPHVKVFDGDTGQQIAGFMAYETEFVGGVTLAVGDVTGDGKADVVTGTGEGGAPRVRVFDIATGGVVQDFFAYESDFRGGVSVVATDVNGDGNAEVITGAGTGGGPVIRIFNGTSGVELASYFSGDPESRDGVTVGLSRTVSGTLLVVGDTHGITGIAQYRIGNTTAGESPLMLLPSDDWIDVQV